jgi:hypothetical protein
MNSSPDFHYSSLTRPLKMEFIAPSFDKLRIRSSVCNGLHLMVRLSNDG